jgi:pimeloyl-ACP methyl ester carboxylesterase
MCTANQRTLMTETALSITPPADRPEWLTYDIWPFPLTTIATREHNLSITDVGDGPTLLIVHVGMWSILWRDVLQELQTTFRCVTLDAPANGITTGPNTVDMVQAAAAVDAVVQHLALDDITLVFHDLGGVATLEAAGRWPERIRGIAAINTFGWRPSGAAFRSMLALMGNPVMREVDVWTGWLPRLTSTRYGVGRQWDKPTRKAFRKGMQHRGRRSFHRYMKSVSAHDFSAIESTVSKLSGLPLLTLFGEKDDPLGFQPKWAERFPNHTQVVVKNGMHFPMCDDPHQVATAITDWHETQVGHA